MEKAAGDPLGTASVCGCKKNYFVADSSATECTACPAGSENAAGDALGLATVCTCKANYYVAAASGTGSCGCTACPTGMGSAAGAVLGTPSSCDRCAADFYVANIGDATCTACPAGTELAAGTDDRDLTVITNQIEFAATTACTVKADFYVATATDTTATACPAGTARDAGGLIGTPTLCDKCPENFHVASTDATACTACPDGLVNPMGIQSITLPTYTAGATTFPTASITTANGCTGSALGAVTAKIHSATAAAGGTGYAVGDEITVADNVGTGTNAVLKVASVTGPGASLSGIKLPTYTAGATAFPTITLTKGTNCNGAFAVGAVTAKVFGAVVNGGNAGSGYAVGEEVTIATQAAGNAQPVGTLAKLVVATITGGGATGPVGTLTVKAGNEGAFTAVGSLGRAALVTSAASAAGNNALKVDITLVPSSVAVTAGAGCTAQSTAVFGGASLAPTTATVVHNDIAATFTVKAGSEGAYTAIADFSAVAQKSTTGFGTSATFDLKAVPSAVAITTAGAGCSRTTPPVVTLAGTALAPTTSTVALTMDAIDLSAAASTLSWCSCPVDTYVKLAADTTCTACPAGFANLAGDEIKTSTAASTATTCDNCPLNTYVATTGATTCTACPAGTERTVRDPIDTGGGDSVVTACTVKANYYMVNGGTVGTACPAGRTRAAGGNIGAATVCTETPCAVNEYVSSNACTACASGFVNAAGDWPSGPDTTCTTTLCAVNERVLDNKCVRCGTVAVNVAGTSTTVITTTTNTAGDDPSGADTLCDGSLCAINQYVKAGVCTACAAGTTNDAHDDASGPDTSCTAVAPGSVPGAAPGAPGGPPAGVSGASPLDVKLTSMISFLVLAYLALAM